MSTTSVILESALAIAQGESLRAAIKEIISYNSIGEDEKLELIQSLIKEGNAND